MQDNLYILHLQLIIEAENKDAAIEWGNKFAKKESVSSFEASAGVIDHAKVTEGVRAKVIPAEKVVSITTGKGWNESDKRTEKS